MVIAKLTRTMEGFPGEFWSIHATGKHQYNFAEICVQQSSSVIHTGPVITASYRLGHVQLITSSLQLGAVVDMNRVEHSKNAFQFCMLSPLIVYVTYFHVPYDRPTYY